MLISEGRCLLRVYVHGIENVGYAWNEVSEIDRKIAMKYVLSPCVNDFHVFDSQMDAILADIAKLGHDLGFNLLDAADIMEWIQIDSWPLDEKSLINIEEQKYEQKCDKKKVCK